MFWLDLIPGSVIVERDVVLIDRRTNRILDIIEDVLGLATGQYRPVRLLLPPVSPIF